MVNYFIGSTQGFVEDESLVLTQMLFGWPELWVAVRALWDIAGPYILLQKHTSEITKDDIDLATAILNQYCGPLDQLNNDQFYNFTKMTTDSFFWYGTHRFLNLHTQHSTGSTYYYRFKYYVSHFVLYLIKN